MKINKILILIFLLIVGSTFTVASMSTTYNPFTSALDYIQNFNDDVTISGNLTAEGTITAEQLNSTGDVSSGTDVDSGRNTFSTLGYYGDTTSDAAEFPKGIITGGDIGDDSEWGSIEYNSTDENYLDIDTVEDSNGVKVLPELTAHNALNAPAGIVGGESDNLGAFSFQLLDGYVVIKSESNYPFKFSGNNSIYMDSGASLQSNSTCVWLESPGGTTGTPVCD